MRFPLLPALIADTVTQLTPRLLQEQGVRLLMLDFDNTIVPYTTDQPTERMQAWLEEMAASQVKVCVVSNSHRDRVKIFCSARGIECVTHAKKPFSKGIRACLAKYEIPIENCALAGDQIFTDVLGANCAGVRSILVQAIDNHNFWLKARHVLEIPWIFAARKRRLPSGPVQKP